MMTVHGKHKSTYCIFNIWLKYSFSTGCCTAWITKVHPVPWFLSLFSFRFIFQKHLGWIKSATRSGMFSSKKRKIKVNIFFLFWAWAVLIVECQTDQQIKQIAIYSHVLLTLCPRERLHVYSCLIFYRCFLISGGIIDNLSWGALSNVYCACNKFVWYI